MLIFRHFWKKPEFGLFLTPSQNTPIFDPPPKTPKNTLFEKTPFFLKYPKYQFSQKPRIRYFTLRHPNPKNPFFAFLSFFHFSAFFAFCLFFTFLQKRQKCQIWCFSHICKKEVFSESGDFLIYMKMGAFRKKRGFIEILDISI